MSTTSPQNPIPSPDVVSTIPESERDKKIKNMPHVALVVGGIGVASFATVGILKRFHEERIRVDLILANGWPALFAVGYSSLKSVHDLEWFAMRLSLRDFDRLGRYDGERDDDVGDKFSSTINQSLKLKNLQEGRIPVVISTGTSGIGNNETVDSGEWQEALLRTLSIPGLFRPFPNESEAVLNRPLVALNTEEAQRRGSRNIVTLSMYPDYIEYAKAPKKLPSDTSIHRLYASMLHQSTVSGLKDADFSAQITLHAPPLEMALKRKAILAGYREGARLAREIRSRQRD